MMEQLILYGTVGCHLCDHASALLDNMGLEYQYIDIVLYDELIETHGTRIPVISWHHNESSLDWPFDVNDVSSWLNQQTNKKKPA